MPAVCLRLLLLCLLWVTSQGVVISRSTAAVTVPRPDETGELPLKHCLSTRRSVREYRDVAIELAEIALLLIGILVT